MTILKEKRVDEKINNLMKVIESEAKKSAIDSLRGVVARNEKMKPFIDAGGKPAAVLAYIIGATIGIESFIAFSLNNTNNGNEQLPLMKTLDYLLKVKAEASTTLKNL